jgi:hypothetical protein
MKRTGFIGGSDCVRIMQGHWLELWQVKTGRAESDDLSRNIAVQMGIHTEDFNLNWFETEHDALLSHHQLEFEKVLGSVPAKGTVDAMFGGNIVEAKHTNAMNNMDNVIEYYMPQIQTYARLADADGIWMSVIFGNNKWESAYVARDQDYFESMWAVVSDFWRHVEEDREPIGVDTPSINIDKIEIDHMVKRDASTDNAFIDSAHTYLEYEQQAKMFESSKKDLKAMVSRDEREVYCDLLTIKRDKRGSLRITTRKT